MQNTDPSAIADRLAAPNIENRFISCPPAVVPYRARGPTSDATGSGCRPTEDPTPPPAAGRWQRGIMPRRGIVGRCYVRRYA